MSFKIDMKSSWFWNSKYIFGSKNILKIFHHFLTNFWINFWIILRTMPVLFFSVYFWISGSKYILRPELFSNRHWNSERFFIYRTIWIQLKVCCASNRFPFRPQKDAVTLVFKDGWKALMEIWTPSALLLHF